MSISTITVTPSLPQDGVPAALIGSSYVPQYGTCKYNLGCCLRVHAQYLVAATTYYCPTNQIWSTEGRYAACCHNVSYVKCPIAVSCLSTSLIVGSDGD